MVTMMIIIMLIKTSAGDILKCAGICVDGDEAEAMRHDLILHHLTNCYKKYVNEAALQRCKTPRLGQRKQSWGRGLAPTCCKRK